MDANFERINHIVGLGIRQTERIRKMLDERELTFEEWARRVLADDLERWEEDHRRRAPKLPGEKRPVGRPRISEEERRFRDNVQKVEQKFIKLRDAWGTAYTGLFGNYYLEFRAAVETKRHGQIEWMVNNMSTLGALPQMLEEEVTQFRREWENER